jgi:hypothetical protein
LYLFEGSRLQNRAAVRLYLLGISQNPVNSWELFLVKRLLFNIAKNTAKGKKKAEKAGILSLTTPPRR